MVSMCDIENERMLTARKQISVKLFYIFVDPSPFQGTPITYHFFYDLNYTELSSCPVQVALSRGNFCQTIKAILSFPPDCSKIARTTVVESFPAISEHLVLGRYCVIETHCETDIWKRPSFRIHYR